ncbi:glycosyltransferase family 39 protein [Desulfosediminicola sp.]|uniref:glycosyltransferase family 39 protein n=1 Tax=Desulfosediminicola sp. TaxID=2886825 RepID=UPI003AF26BDB
MHTFSIIIPTLNEAGNIEPLLHRLEKLMQQQGMTPEILFVDDGSKDHTRQIIEGYRGILDVRLICRDTERGLTGAVVRGAEAASNDLIVVMDADLSHPPEVIPELIAPIMADECEMCIGSRYTAGGATPGWPQYRQAASQLASLPARILTGVRDPLAGFFAVHKRYITAVTNDLSGFKIGLEILAGSKQPPRVQEVPIVFQDRFSGSSKMNYSILGQYLSQLSRLTAGRIEPRKTLPLLLLVLSLGLCDLFLSGFMSRHGYQQTTASFISLFITAHCCYFILPFTADSGVYKAQNTNGPNYLTFLSVLLLGLFLRDGVLALPLFQAETTAMVTQYLCTLCCLTAAVILSRTSLQPLRNRPAYWRWFGGSLILYTVIIRLVYLGDIELLQEEAYYWNYAQHMAPGYLDHPPMVALLIRGGTLLFGNSELGVRFLTFLCWFVTAFFTFRLSTRMFEEETAFRAVLLVAVLPIFFCTGLLSTPDAPLIACWAGALYYLYLALVQNREKAWYGAGIFLGLGLASKYTIALLAPAIILFMLADSSARRYFLRPQPYLAALLALSIFSPVIWWNSQHEWASFLFQSQERLQASSEFSTHELLASILLLLTPTGFLAVLSAWGDWFSKGQTSIHLNNKFNRQRLFGLTMLLVPLSIFILVSITKEVKVNWTGPLWLSVIPFMASAMFSRNTKFNRAVAGMWPKTLIIMVLCYGGLLHYSAIGIPGVPFRNVAFLFGWDDLARQVDEQVLKVSEQQGHKPLVVGMDHYQIASGLAFYRSKPLPEADVAESVAETTGRQIFGSGALMYNYWHPPTMADNKDILAVAHKKDMLAENRFTNKCEKVGAIQELVVEKQGKPAGHYYYRLLSGYNWDSTESHSQLTRVETNSLAIQKDLTMVNEIGNNLL